MSSVLLAFSLSLRVTARGRRKGFLDWLLWQTHIFRLSFHCEYLQTKWVAREDVREISNSYGTMQHSYQSSKKLVMTKHLLAWPLKLMHEILCVPGDPTCIILFWNCMNTDYEVSFVTRPSVVVVNIDVPKISSMKTWIDMGDSRNRKVLLNPGQWVDHGVYNVSTLKIELQSRFDRWPMKTEMSRLLGQFAI